MYITTKQNDPIADHKLVDAYFRWALMALADVAGEAILDSVLKAAGMEKFRQVYGSNQLAPVSGLTFRDYANINAGVLKILGDARTVEVFHSGRVSARHAMRMNGQIFHLPDELLQGQLDLSEQLKTSLETILKSYRDIAQQVGLEYNAWLSESETHFYYHLETCAVCAGKSSDEPICMFFTGSLMESLRWFTGRKFNAVEVECRAMDAPTCTWQIEKHPVGSSLIHI